MMTFLVFPYVMLAAGMTLPFLLKQKLQPLSLPKLVLTGLAWGFLCSTATIVVTSLNNYPYYSADPSAWGEIKSAVPNIPALWLLSMFPTYAGLSAAYLLLKRRGKTAQSPFAARPGFSRLLDSATTAFMAVFALWVIAAMAYITYGITSGKIDEQPSHSTAMA